jgi:hypothetical protein
MDKKIVKRIEEIRAVICLGDQTTAEAFEAWRRDHEVAEDLVFRALADLKSDAETVTISTDTLCSLSEAVETLLILIDGERSPQKLWER